MVENPWRLLPQKPPYVLASDEPLIREFNDRLIAGHDHLVQTDTIVPEPFVGNPNAPVVLLSNNPSFGRLVHFRQAPDFAAKMRRNLLHEHADYPLLFLDPVFGGPWWRSKLKELIAIFGQQEAAHSVLNVTYFPYPSKTFGHGRLHLPSQEYSFHLVAAAMSRGAAIVFMRPGKKKLWFEVLPELSEYRRLFEVENPQTPAISERNCKGFGEIVRTIENAFADARFSTASG